MKREIWEKSKERGFDFSFKETFITLIEQYFDRVEFVKCHVGVRDVVFMAEKGCNYRHNFFVAFDVNADKENTYTENKMKFEEKMETRELIALSKLESIFKETDRTVYIGIGFRECLEQVTIMDVLNSAFDDPGKTTEEIIRNNRKFPDWYKKYAKFPEEIDFLPKKVSIFIKEVLDNDQRQLLQQKINLKIKRESSKENLLKNLLTELTS